MMGRSKLDRFRVWIYRKGYWASAMVWAWSGYAWLHMLPAEERAFGKKGFWEAYHRARSGEDVVIPGRGRKNG